jgi:O-antigen/teichoic acid export membrane protein
MSLRGGTERIAPPDPVCGRGASVLSRMVHALLSTIALQVAGFASGILIARLLGPANRGELSQIIAWFSFLAPICLMGLNDAVVYFRAAGEDADQVLYAALAGSAVTIAAGLLLCVAALHLRLSHLSPSAVRGAWVFLLFVPGFHLSNIFSSYLQAGRHVWPWTIQRVAYGPLYVLLIGVAALLGHASVFGIAAANTGAVLIPAILGWVFIQADDARAVRPAIQEVARFFRFGAPLTLQKLSVVIRDNLDRMVLPFFISAAALGDYVVAATAAYLIFVVAASVDLVSFPAIVRAAEGARRKEAAEGFVSVTIALTLAGTAILVLIAPPLVVVLFGAPFAGAIPLVAPFVVAGALQGIRMVFGGVFKAYGRPGALAWVEAVNSVVMVAVLVGFGRSLGMWAGVMAHLVSAATSCVLAAILAVTALGLSPLKIIVPDRKHIATLISAGQDLLARRAAA